MAFDHQLMAASRTAAAPSMSPARSLRDTRVATVAGVCCISGILPRDSAARRGWPAAAATCALAKRTTLDLSGNFSENCPKISSAFPALFSLTKTAA
ncbi:hypothetical protein ACFXTN_010596 [Malus domestica]